MPYFDIFSFTDEQSAKNFFNNEVGEDKKTAGIFITPAAHLRFVLDSKLPPKRLNETQPVYSVITLPIDTVLQLDQVKIQGSTPAGILAPDGGEEDSAGSE